MIRNEAKISPALHLVHSCFVRADRGLLPWPNPLERFPEGLPDIFYEIDELAKRLPEYLYDGSIRMRLLQLPLVSFERLEGPLLNLAFLYYSFFTSAYGWADCIKNLDAPHARMIPHTLAVPLSRMAEKLGVPPILAYFMYAMHNFAVIDSKKPIQFDNLRLIQHFTIPPYDRDENGFILPHVEIEAKAAPGLLAIPRAQYGTRDGDKEKYIYSSWAMESSLRDMTRVLKKIPFVCNPDIYYRHIRPWIFYFKDISFEGVGHFPLLKGETGAESPSILSFDRALRICHKPTGLTDHLRELRSYRPSKQARWLRAIERGPSLRKFARKYRNDRHIRGAFNAVHEALIDFRTMHYKTALTYIKEKGRGDVATGGTHYEIFLTQLIRETRENML